MKNKKIAAAARPSRKTATRKPSKAHVARKSAARKGSAVVRKAKAPAAVPVAEVVEPTTPIATLPDITDKIVLIKWSRTRFSNKARVRDKSKMNTTASDRMVTMHKRLLTSPEYGRILSHDTYITDYLLENAMAVKTLFGRAGVYAISLANVDTIHAELEKRAAVRAQLVDAFVASYADNIVRTREELGDLFDQNDYPDAEKMRASFSCEWSFFNLGVPASLQERLSPAIFAQERERVRGQLNQIAFEVRDVLRIGLTRFVDGMIERLSPTEDGKRKAIHETFVTKFNEFLDSFVARNVTGDTAMEDLVAKARDIINGGDVEDFRRNDKFRDVTLRKLEEVNASLQEFVVERRSRMITLDDDEEAVA